MQSYPFLFSAQDSLHPEPVKRRGGSNPLGSGTWTDKLLKTSLYIKCGALFYVLFVCALSTWFICEGYRLWRLCLAAEKLTACPWSASLLRGSVHSFRQRYTGSRHPRTGLKVGRNQTNLSGVCWYNII